MILDLPVMIEVLIACAVFRAGRRFWRRALNAAKIALALKRGARKQIQSERWSALGSGEVVDFEDAPPEVQAAIRQAIGANVQALASQAPAELAAGRQRINAGIQITGHSLLGLTGKPWSPPVPPGAQSADWVDLHRFPAGKPTREPWGLTGDPPLSLVCVGCELEQAPLHDERVCGYCGLTMKAVGSRVFWWRAPTPTPEPWEPKT